MDADRLNSTIECGLVNAVLSLTLFYLDFAPAEHLNISVELGSELDNLSFKLYEIEMVDGPGRLSEILAEEKNRFVFSWKDIYQDLVSGAESEPALSGDLFLFQTIARGIERLKKTLEVVAGSCPSECEEARVAATRISSEISNEIGRIERLIAENGSNSRAIERCKESLLKLDDIFREGMKRSRMSYGDPT